MMLLLTNNHGGFFLTSINSKFRGLFLNIDNEVFKIIDKIVFPDDAKPKFQISQNALFVSLSKKAKIQVFLDIKKAYDSRVWGRSYEFVPKGDNLFIKFTKSTDLREDKSLKKEFSLRLNISLDKIEYKIMNNWVNQDFIFDKSRNSKPFDRFVFHAVDLVGKDFVFSLGNPLNPEKSIPRIYKKISNLQINKAFKSAIFSLNDLVVHDGLYAGLPWFFQFWSRDELISSIGLIKNYQSDLAKSILFKNLSHINKDGRLPNIIGSNITNADAIGWLFKRFQQLKLKRSEKKQLSYAIQFSLMQLLENYEKNGLLINDSKETWMDTDWNNDNRQGARIEIQAMLLNMLSFAYELTKNDKYKNLEVSLKQKVRDVFFKNNYLWDGMNDPTIRPNIFIAYYIYPELLSKEEWIKCFDLILPKLWLDWGGLSSIDKSSSLFMNNSTGEIPASYHRGDSWFWINNLAALVLYKIDAERYKNFISKIVKASTHEINHLGIIGCHAELSSASELKSEGCLSQAWSAATFIELINEIY